MTAILNIKITLLSILYFHILYKMYYICIKFVYFAYYMQEPTKNRNAIIAVHAISTFVNCFLRHTSCKRSFKRNTLIFRARRTLSTLNHMHELTLIIFTSWISKNCRQNIELELFLKHHTFRLEKNNIIFPKFWICIIIEYYN